MLLFSYSLTWILFCLYIFSSVFKFLLSKIFIFVSSIICFPSFFVYLFSYSLTSLFLILNPHVFLFSSFLSDLFDIFTLYANLLSIIFLSFDIFFELSISVIFLSFWCFKFESSSFILILKEDTSILYLFSFFISSFLIESLFSFLSLFSSFLISCCVK